MSLGRFRPEDSGANTSDSLVESEVLEWGQMHGCPKDPTCSTNAALLRAAAAPRVAL